MTPNRNLDIDQLEKLAVDVLDLLTNEPIEWN